MRWRQGIRARSTLVGALACLILVVASSARAQDSGKKYPFDIPRQPLTLALEQFFAQVDVSYGYSPDTREQEEMQVGPLRGEYTIDEALTELLRSTGLTFSRIGPRNIAIVPAPPPPKAATPPPKPPRAARRVTAATPRQQKVDDTTLEEVIIQASRVRNLPVPTAPGFVLDRKAIAQTGVATIMDLLKLIPQQPFLRPDGFRSNGAQYAELRGLGPDTTLVLINGLPAFASAASFTVNAFDLNQLPLSAVERVEVQLDSISVRHGANAIGGIINIVLRDDIDHPSIEARYGDAAGGGRQRQAAISAGLGDEDARAAVVLDYRDVAPLFGAERDLWRNQDYRRFGSTDLRSTISSPGNVMALDGSLDRLGAPFAAIPQHSAGSVTGLSEFLPFQLNRESLLQYAPIVAEDRRASVVASAQAHVTADLVAAADLMFVDRHITFDSFPPLVSAMVPATNPYNLFGEPVLVTELLEGVDALRVTTDSRLIRGAGSLRGRVQSWDWELSLLRSEEDAQQRIDNVLVDLPQLALVLADPDPDRTLNLFGPGPAASPEVLASVLKPPDIDTFATDATQLLAVVSGDLFSVPAGQVSTVLGTEWRKETVQFDSLLGAFTREIAGGFAELELPLLDERMQLPGARDLTVTIAGRFDDYTDFGEIFSPQYGLVWHPFREVAIRATYGRSFRPPALYELYLPRTLSPTLVVDPRRNGESYLAMQLAGGTRELEATRGESFAAGIDFTPQAFEPLKLSATYWHVMMDERVIALNPLFAVTHESQVADRVLRAAPTAADLAAGLPGRVLQIDVTRMNFGRLTTSGIDVGASYAFDSAAAGHFVADAKATWIDEYEALDLPGVPAADRVNVANSFGTIAKWRGVASLDWHRGALGAATYLRYIPGYDDTRDGVRNGRTIPSQTFLDLQLSVDLGKLMGGAALLRGVEFTAGAINALNQEPHFAEVNGIQGYDTSQGDLKGRFWYLRLGKTF
ncbi:MAG TPA: TonB-dependent receptor [Steroidobacteraceae bacterium]|nr:TonB-dependent receptor [Steroidobacteraceae bacterium]